MEFKRNGENQAGKRTKRAGAFFGIKALFCDSDTVTRRRVFSAAASDVAAIIAMLLSFGKNSVLVLDLTTVRVVFRECAR